MAAPSVPPTYRALQFTSSTTPPSLVSLPTPPLTASTALIRPLRANLFAYTRSIFTLSNPRGYHYPLPLVPGSPTIGRILSASSDAPTLQSPSHLVFVSPVIRASDNSPTSILHGLNSGPSAAGKALAAREWRNGSWGEVVRVPAGNVHLLDEHRLFNELGYTLDDLGYLQSLMIVYGGLRDVDVRAGEVVLVAPATGSFGGAAVSVALALGAGVIALGRNGEVLRELEGDTRRAYPGGRISTVVMTGEEGEDLEGIIRGAARELGRRDGAVDVYFDMSPPSASQSAHIKAGIAALRPKGRMSLMGGVAGDVGFPYYQIMVKGLRLQGSWMFTPEQAGEVIRLVEAGILKLGEGAGAKCLGVFGLEEWEEAFRVAGDEARVARFALFAPSGKEAQ